MNAEKSKKKTPLDIWNDVMSKVQSFFDTMGKNTEEFFASVENAGKQSKETLDSVGQNTKEALDAMAKNIREFFDKIGEESRNILRNTKNKLEEIPQNIRNIFIGKPKEARDQEERDVKKESKEETKQHANVTNVDQFRKESKELNAAINQIKQELTETKEQLAKTREKMGESKHIMDEHRQKLIETNRQLDETKQVIENLTKLQFYLLFSYYQDHFRGRTLTHEDLESELKKLMDKTHLNEQETKLINEFLESPQLEFNREAIQQFVALLTNKLPKVNKLDLKDDLLNDPS